MILLQNIFLFFLHKKWKPVENILNEILLLGNECFYVNMVLDTYTLEYHKSSFLLGRH